MQPAFRLLVLIVSTFLVIPVWAADSDIGETNEIRFFPQFNDESGVNDLNLKATTLGSPAAIYEYVRNNHDFTLYHGARSGSINTFQGARGNDVDQAATLIAMLRALGFHARYAVGTVRMSSAQVMNWLGVKNADLAYGILRDQGIQGVVLSADKSTIDMEHVWVEVLVAYGEYRGGSASGATCSVASATCHWVSLDPSFKQRQARTSGLDPYASLSFDYTAYYNALKNNDSTRRDKNPLEIYQNQVLDWLHTNALGKTLDDIPDFLGIVPEEDGLLPASLPFITVGNVRRYNSAADHDVQVPTTEPKKWTKHVGISVELIFNGVAYQSAEVLTTLPDAATQRLTLTSEIVDGLPGVVIRLGGTVIANPIASTSQLGGYVPQFGDAFTIKATLDGAPAPASGGTDQLVSASYNAIIGGYYLVASGGETSNWSQVHRAAKQLLDANTLYPIVINTAEPGCLAGGMNCTPYVDANGNGWDASDARLLDSQDAQDVLTGGLLHVAATQYYAKLREHIARVDQLNKIISPISAFLGVVSSTYEVEYIDGTAFAVLPGGLLLDMKGIALAGSWRIDQASNYSSKQFELIGHMTSSLEHETWQQLTGYDAISTVRGIQMALANGASLVDAKKNASVDTVPAMFTSFGFGAAAPSPFAINLRNIYSSSMASWSHTTTDGTQGFVLLKQAPSSVADTRLARLTYHNDYVDSDLACFYNIQNQLQSLLTTYGPNAQLSAGSLCLSPYATGTTVQQAITLNQSDYATYRTEYIGAAFIDYLDQNKGFVPTQFAYRSSSVGEDAQFSTTASRIRDDLNITVDANNQPILRDFSKSWVQYLIPSKLAYQANYYRFSVDIRKRYETATGDLIDASYEIANGQGIAAGGGFVTPDKPMMATAAEERK